MCILLALQIFKKLAKQQLQVNFTRKLKKYMMHLFKRKKEVLKHTCQNYRQQLTQRCNATQVQQFKEVFLGFCFFFFVFQGIFFTLKIESTFNTFGSKIFNNRTVVSFVTDTVTKVFIFWKLSKKFLSNLQFMYVRQKRQKLVKRVLTTLVVTKIYHKKIPKNFQSLFKNILQKFQSYFLWFAYKNFKKQQSVTKTCIYIHAIIIFSITKQQGRTYEI
eukprot:TRINITY_DN28067_c2_g1_i2.p3 TRINITY_DN28067_c2_g1~~TRINITY_DN28067_c2_g1_i2.p3  ORF type:complete len:218 (+),score=4.07 TRINITY_DN28067_c2_g1_i2:793-1446(+)